MRLLRKKILIVEDNFEIYEGLVNFFKAKGLIIIGNNDANKAVDNYDDAKKLAELHQPDIAVIDIQLKGKKNGLDLSDYIKTHLNTFTLILSDSRSADEFERAKLLFVDDYIRKIEKTADKERIWDTINYHYPFTDITDKNSGRRFNVHEEKSNSSTGQHEFMQVFIFWEKLLWIESNTAAKKNNICFYTNLPEKVWVARGSLSEVMKILPSNFIRINRYQIINKDLVTGKKSKKVYYIGKKEFKIGLYYSEAINKLEI